VSPEGLSLADGRLIPSQCVIWTAGNRVNEVVGRSRLPKARDGDYGQRVLEVESAPGVYALGDNAAQRDPHSKELYPATAQVALRQGLALGGAARRGTPGPRGRPFDFRLLGEMVPLSAAPRRRSPRIKLTGFPAWFLWKTCTCSSCRRSRLASAWLLDWTVELFFER